MTTVTLRPLVLQLDPNGRLIQQQSSEIALSTITGQADAALAINAASGQNVSFQSGKTTVGSDGTVTINGDSGQVFAAYGYGQTGELDVGMPTAVGGLVHVYSQTAPDGFGVTLNGDARTVTTAAVAGRDGADLAINASNGQKVVLGGTGSYTASFDSFQGVLKAPYEVLQDDYAYLNIRTGDGTNVLAAYVDAAQPGGSKLDAGTIFAQRITSDDIRNMADSFMVTSAGALTAATATLGAATVAAPVNGLSLISNIADPVSAQDAATKYYVDAVAQGLDVKGSCLAATTENIALDGSVTEVDGVAIPDGSRVLVKNQDNATENGIYVASSTEGWSRAADMNAPEEFPGAFTFIEEGTAQADTGWVCTTNAPVVIGSSDITFVQFSAAGVIEAGSGLQKVGNTLSVVAADGTISVDSTGVAATGDFLSKNITTTGAASAASVYGETEVKTAGTLAVINPSDPFIVPMAVQSDGSASFATGAMTIGADGAVTAKSLTGLSGEFLNINAAAGQYLLLQNGNVEISSAGLVFAPDLRAGNSLKVGGSSDPAPFVVSQYGEVTASSLSTSNGAATGFQATNVGDTTVNSLAINTTGYGYDASGNLTAASATLGAAVVAAASGGLSLISNVADPVAAQDAATKQYVDAAVSSSDTPMTAGEALSAGDPLVIDPTTGYAIKAQATGGAGYQYCIGVAQAAANMGESVQVLRNGVASGVLSSATAGSAYYIAPSGGLSTDPGTGAQWVLVGYAMTATDLMVQIQDYGYVAA